MTSLTDSVKVVLLDIEGTTTPIDFVYKTLFPFARAQMESFVDQHFESTAVRKAIEILEADHATEKETGLPEWSPTAAGASQFALWLMDRDRKATGLKALQGLIWKEGYNTGELKATLYDDVAPAIQRWTTADKQVCIYSSGSVLAQKLLFGHTIHGDLTNQLSGYFDTTTGSKREASSYRVIADQLNVSTHQILFLSDMVPELDAAFEAGLEVGLIARDDLPENPNGFPVLKDFQGL